MSGAMFIKIVTVLGLIGVPSIFAMCGWCMKTIIKYNKHLKILMRAQKAQMRSQLLVQFHKYEDQGYVTEEDLEDWENQYKAYHELVGENGVLDARRDTLLKMPNKSQQ